jgi:hypothetical protein
MMKKMTIDIFIEYELEQALIYESERIFLFNLEDDLNKFISGQGNYDYVIVTDKSSIEIEFKNLHYKNSGILLLKRYIPYLKNEICLQNSENFAINGLKIYLNKNCELKMPILKLSYFFDKSNRCIDNEYVNKDYSIW